MLIFLAFGAHAQQDLGRAPLHIGPVDLHPHLDFAIAYDDNVFIRRNNRQGDFSFVTSPGLQLVYGQTERNFIALDYTAGIERFLRLSSQDANNQFVKLDGHFEIHQLTIGLSHRFQDIKGPNTQVGARIRSQDNLTNIDLEYRLSSKTSFGIGYGQYIHDYMLAGLYDSREYTPYATFFYHITPKTDLFLRFGYGWVIVNRSPSAEYQQVDIGLRGKLTAKTTGTVRLGYQHRSFDHTYGDIHSVVAGVDVETALTRRTALTLGFNRSVNPSPSIPGNSYEATRVDAKLTHRFPRNKVAFWIAGAYEHDDYEQPVGTVDRTDSFFEASAGIGWDVTKWMQLGAEYRFWHNDSRLTGLDFHRNVVMIHARVHF
ncbi:MAG: outer membrane beta-barrel protein [Verrucomicrobiae bacterium]|nr:outer membrane beta-barrel protein [Verrucomicrobiae bacterium]